MRSVANRIARIFESFKGDAVLLYNTGLVDSNFLYMSGFTSGIFENSTLIVTRRGMLLLTSELEYDTARSQMPREMTVEKCAGGKQLGDKLSAHLRGKVVGVNADFLPYKHFINLKKLSKAKGFIDASAAFSDARLIKDPDEIGSIREAVNIVKRSFAEIDRYFKEGITEKELAAEFDYIMRKHGAAEPSFKTIIAFGKNAALPHHAPDNTRLKENEFVLIDAGAKYKNYCSDLTRTFIFKPDTKSEKYRRMQDMIEVVRKAQSLALKAIRPGEEGSDIHKVAADYINSAHNGIYKGKFIHGLGHSIGIDVHDGARISSLAKTKLEKGMIFSDEPGIYLVGFGGVRFEDDVLVEENGGRFL
jgi:Xaa-Pro aminopeptidase